MSSYYPSFQYMGLNSLKDKKLIVVAFDADQGEVDTFLGMDCIYTEKADGTRRLDYGAKFNSVATIKISVMKRNQEDFTVSEVRDFLKWTTGIRKNSYLDLMAGDTVKCSFLGRVTNAYQQKIDARTVGLSIEFTSISPWAYSSLQIIKCSFGQELFVVGDGVVTKSQDSVLLDVDDKDVLYNGTDGGVGVFNITDDGIVHIDNSVRLLVDNQSDDLYTYVNLNTKFVNDNSDYISIKNNTIGEETIIEDMLQNEVITLSAEQFILSDVPYRKNFGNRFNFVWPRLAPGINEIVISGSGKGHVECTYRYPIKIGDCAIDINDLLSICGDYSDDDFIVGDNTSSGNSGSNNNGGVVSGYVPWSNITGKPSTVRGYGITDVYTAAEIDEKLKNISTTSDNIYVQDDEPTNANNGALWIDTDAYMSISENDIIYIQNDEPDNAENGSLWIDMDDGFNGAGGSGSPGGSGSIDMTIDEDELNSMLESILK